MISIKKYLDQKSEAAKKDSSGKPEELLTAALTALEAALEAMGEQAARACPATGGELQDRLKKIAHEIATGSTTESVQEGRGAAEQQLRVWSAQTSQHLQKKADEVREILLALAKTSEAAWERNTQYAGKFNEITQQLKSIANLDDLGQVRAIVLKSAAALHSSTTRMTDDQKQVMLHLKAQVTAYQSKLEEAERLAHRDMLTGLRNRLSIERQIELRIQEKRIFCLIMLDLNGFKQVNDTYGHDVGDDLLKQFSAEMQAASRATDLVGRWGGDEFFIIVDAALASATTQVQRLKEWVCGEYTLNVQGSKVKVSLGASIGVVESTKTDTVAEIMKRADQAMYAAKKSTRENAAGAGR